MKIFKNGLKFLIYISLIFGLTVNAFGEGQKKITIDKSEVVIRTVCLDGYLFAVAASNKDVSIVQVYQKFNRFANPPVPKTCGS